MALYVRFFDDSVAQAESIELSRPIIGEFVDSFSFNRLFLQPR